jgi:selenocysteine lyase/cysteine desulfurase
MSEIDWKKIRLEYPELSKKGIYLNTASIGLLAQSQQKIAEEAIHKMSYGFFDFRQYFLNQLNDIRSQIAPSVSCPPEYLALVPNLSFAIHSVAQMLLPLQKIMLFKGDYPALNFPFQKLGYEITWLEHENDLEVASLHSHLLKSKVKVLALSWVQFKTGYGLALDKIAQICKELDVLLVIDATQSWCVFKTDLQKNQNVIFAASAYKWATAGLGMGILAMSPTLLERFPPSMISTNLITTYNYIEDIDSIPLSMEVFELGHPNALGTLMLQHGLQNIQKIGLDVIKERVLSLARSLTESLQSKGFKVLSSLSEEHLSGIVSIPYDQKLLDYLQSNQVSLTGRGETLRMSVHFYNNFEDIDYLTEILKKY